MDDHHAAPAEHETRAHQHGITDFLRHGERFGSGVRDAALRLQDADLFGKLLEVVAVQYTAVRSTLSAETVLLPSFLVFLPAKSS